MGDLARGCAVVAPGRENRLGRIQDLGSPQGGAAFPSRRQ
jgi:hypothetical protein